MDFTDILKGFCEKTGAQGAAMIDKDGEVVAFWSTDAGPDMELVGAHYEIILDTVSAAIAGRALGAVSSVLISTDRTALAIMPIKEGYCLVTAFDRDAPSGMVLFEAAKAVESIETEMG